MLKLAVLLACAAKGAISGNMASTVYRLGAIDARLVIIDGGQRPFQLKDQLSQRGRRDAILLLYRKPWIFWVVWYVCAEPGCVCASGLLLVVLGRIYLM